MNPGAYRLVVEIQGKKTYVNFRVKGNLDIVNQTVTYKPVTGDSVSTFYKPGTKWEFVDKALAGTRVPLYVSAVVDGDIDLLSAAGQNCAGHAGGIPPAAAGECAGAEAGDGGR